MRSSFWSLPAFLALALAANPALAQPHVPLPDPIPALIPVSPLKLTLRPVATGLVSPIAAAVAPGDEDFLYVVDQPGQIWRVAVSDEAPGRTLFLDVSKRLVKLGLFPPLNYDERGLLGLAFHPNFERNGLFYTFTSEPVKGRADFSTLDPGQTADCQSVITEWRATRPAGRGGDDRAAPVVDPASARELMRIDKPQFNHNGGALAFGPDRLLYISLGDGGNANDVAPGHAPGGNAQSLAPGNVLGKILRINPTGTNSANHRYGIPADNPFVGKAHGAAEIYAYGLRNPFRMSFDTKTGALIVGDVGQNDIEEIDIIRKGGNYGWPIKEGTFLFDNGGGLPTSRGFVYANSPGSPAGLIDPIAQYDHADGAGLPETRVAVIGGYVYRGDEINGLRGNYLFGDYSGEIGTPVAGHIFTLTGPGATLSEVRIKGHETGLGLAVLGFGQDSQGEIYLLGNESGTLTGTTGQVLRFGPASRGTGRRDD